MTLRYRQALQNVCLYNILTNLTDLNQTKIVSVMDA
jgi:hypothetical protein